jgi:hypothetical protein
MMKSTLLFYRKLVSELREMGFEINPSIHVLQTRQ